MKYEKFKKKCDDKSSVWHYFLRAEDCQSGKCNLCGKVIRSHGGTTSGLRVHLKSAHTIDTNSKSDFEESNSSSLIQTSPTPTTAASKLKDQSPTTSSLMAKKRKLTDYFQSTHSLEATVSRMVALDGIAFSVFCTSEDQRRLFISSGYNKLPKTPKGIKNIVMNYAKQEKIKLVAELKQLLMSGKKFSLSFDEWTSTRNARYVNVNIHSGDEFADGSRFKNLGLVRMDGSMPAETCIRLLKVKLSEFGLSLDQDTVAIVTDGASVMLKVGRNLRAHHQVCLAHGIQLAVLDVIYKQGNAENVQFPNTAGGSDSESENDRDSAEEEAGGFEVVVTAVESNTNELNSDYKSIISKVRAVVKIFKNSPVKNDMFLQKHVKHDMGKELQLLADCKTRWGSIATMVDRFNRIRSCVSKALIDMKSDIQFTQDEYNTLDSIQNSLNIIKVTVEALCRRDATLLTADAAMRFMLRKLDSQHSTLSRLLARSLRVRISERRLSIASTLQYLQNPETFFSEVATEEFPKNPNMLKEIYSLIKPFEGESVVMYENVVDSSNTSVSEAGESVDFAEELNKEIEKSLKEKDVRNINGGEGDAEKLQIEMALFENGGARGSSLDLAYRHLLTIPPTSVESERAFSSAAYTCSKIRSSLKDETLDALCFLRSIFKQSSNSSKP